MEMTAVVDADANLSFLPLLVISNILSISVLGIIICANMEIKRNYMKYRTSSYVPVYHKSAGIITESS